jgi:hypothetical protein
LEEGFSCIRMEGKSETSDGATGGRGGFDWDVVDLSNSRLASRARNEEVRSSFS